MDDEDLLISYKIEEPDENGEIPANQVLEYALDHLKDVAIVGRTKDGAMYFASNIVRKSEINWLLDRFKNRLFWED